MQEKINLNPNCSELILRLPCKTYGEAVKLLISAGIYPINVTRVAVPGIMEGFNKVMLFDWDNINTPDFMNMNIVSLRDTICFRIKATAVSAYPTIRKLSLLYDEPVDSIEEHTMALYDRWLEDPVIIENNSDAFLAWRYKLQCKVQRYYKKKYGIDVW